MQLRAILGIIPEHPCHYVDDGLDYRYVLFLVETAYVVHLAGASVAKHCVDGAAVVVDIEPVAHILSLSVDGQGNAFEHIVEDKRDEFLGELGGAVVVGAAGYVYRQSEGFAVGLCEHIGACFGCRIGGAWCKGSGFLEKFFSESLEVLAPCGHTSCLFIEHEFHGRVEIPRE